MLKEKLNTYRQHIRQAKLQLTDVQGHIKTCSVGNYADFCNSERHQSLKRVI